MQHKRGDTFSFSGTVRATVNGTENTDFAGWAASSQLRQPNKTLVTDLDVTWLDQSTGLIKLEHTGSTQDWPLGDVQMDIQFTSGSGEIVSTETVTFENVDDVTKAA